MTFRKAFMLRGAGRLYLLLLMVIPYLIIGGGIALFLGMYPD